MADPWPSLAPVTSADDSVDVNFGHGGNSHMFKRDGWHGPDGQFSWTQGNKSTLLFRAPFDVDIVGISIEIAPILWPEGNINTQHFSIIVNDELIADQSLDKPRKLNFTFLPVNFDSGKEIEIHLIHPLTVRPIDMNHTSDDTRQLSVSVYNFSLNYRPRRISSLSIIRAAFRGSRTAQDAVMSRMWCSRSLENGGYRVEVSESNLIAVIACCAPRLRIENGQLVIALLEPLALSIPFAVLGGKIGVRISVHGCNADSHDLLARLHPLIDGKPPQPTWTIDDEVAAWELNDIDRQPNVIIQIAYEGVAGAQCLVMDRLNIAITESDKSMSRSDEESFLGALDLVATTEMVDQAEIVINSTGQYISNTAKLLETITRIARSKCDAALETRALLEAYLRGHSDGVDLAMRVRSQGRPMVSAAILEARIANEPSHVRAHYELGVAYRALGWYARAMRAFDQVPDPHPHWAGVILWTRKKLHEQRTKALSILGGRRGRLDNDRALELCRCLLSLSHSLAARCLITQYSAPDRNEWMSLGAIIDVFECGAAAIAHLAALATWYPTEEAGGHRRVSKVLTWVLLESGRYELAAEMLLDDYRRTHDIFSLANASMAASLSAENTNLVEEWNTHQPPDILNLYEAEMFVSIAIRDRKSRSVTLINRKFEEVAPPPPVKNIIQFWDDKIPPADVRECIQSWREHNPEYNHMLFSDETARDFIQQQFGDELTFCYDICHHPAMKSDLFRMLALYHYGGIYFDCDLACNGPLERTLMHDLIGTVGIITVPVVPGLPYAINNDIISAAKGSPFIKRTAERAVARIQEDFSAGVVSDIGQVTGPGLYTRMIATSILERNRGGAAMDGMERYIIIPFSYRKSILHSRGDLQYFRTRTHWSVAQQRRA